MKPLDDNTLESLADLICGDGGPYYRQGWKLPLFFRAAGLDCPDHDGSTRKYWSINQLEEYNENPEMMAAVIKRIADPKAYTDSPEVIPDVLDKLNNILAMEGLAVGIEGITPVIKSIDPHVPVLVPQETIIIEPVPDFSSVIQDATLVRILDDRWCEAQECFRHEAFLASIIMMGSLLEGMMIALVLRKPKEANQAKSSPKDPAGNVRKFSEWTLNDLISVAHECGWIQGDIKRFAHALRDYRNLVHPLGHLKSGENPDRDTCRICWEISKAAINDMLKVR